MRQHAQYEPVAWWWTRKEIGRQLSETLRGPSKLTFPLIFLSMGVVLYPQGVRSQTPYSTAAAPDRYCAKPSKETEPPDCSFANMKDCRASLKAKGGGRCYKQ
jgi:hypothetical protein